VSTQPVPTDAHGTVTAGVAAGRVAAPALPEEATPAPSAPAIASTAAAAPTARRLALEDVLIFPLIPVPFAKFQRLIDLWDASVPAEVG